MKEFVFYYVLLVFSLNTHGLLLWKVRESITITNAFQKIFKESNCKPNKIWEEKGSEFDNRSMK